MTELKNGFHDEFEEIKIPVPWGHISGKWWGSRQVQPIIAIHGWQDNSGSFDNLAPILRDKGLSLLCIDLPGHGFSSHFPSGQYYYIFWDGIHILRRIVKHFNFKQITILGHSLGGGIAFLYAATFPEEVKRYVSLDIASPSVRDPKKLVNILGNSVDKFLFYDSLTEDQVPVYEYDDMVQIMFEAHAGSLTKESSEVMLRRGIKKAERGNGFVFTRDPRLKVPVLGFISIEQTLELASRITCEVLNVRAKPGTKFDFPEYYQMVLDAIQDSAKKVVRKEVDGTHHVHLNDAKVVADAICNFLTD